MGKRPIRVPRSFSEASQKLLKSFLEAFQKTRGGLAEASEKPLRSVSKASEQLPRRSRKASERPPGRFGQSGSARIPNSRIKFECQRTVFGANPVSMPFQYAPRSVLTGLALPFASVRQRQTSASQRVRGFFPKPVACRLGALGVNLITGNWFWCTSFFPR